MQYLLCAFDDGIVREYSKLSDRDNLVKLAEQSAHMFFWIN